MPECKAFGHFASLNIALECACGELTSVHLKDAEDWVLVTCPACGKEYEFHPVMFVQMREKARVEE